MVRSATIGTSASMTVENDADCRLATPPTLTKRRLIAGTTSDDEVVWPVSV
jgi:hypothetical protein